MVAPGILGARYERLAGAPAKRRELYYARKILRFSIDEWLALPWWQRRVYVEQMQEEADERAAESSGNSGKAMSPFEMLMGDLETEAAG